MSREGEFLIFDWQLHVRSTGLLSVMDGQQVSDGRQGRRVGKGGGGWFDGLVD
jgi:hypothetical protein